ncbi:MAG: hypothetical protein LV481_09970 [Methylacidiphilales bacterium]|nr:hypothetical protein [Candidatus Methylacidiphilales bacterium]
MNGSAVGTPLTPLVLSAGTIGFTGGKWNYGTCGNSAGLTVGPHHISLPGSVTVGGAIYPAGYSTQSIAYDNGHNFSSVIANIPGNFTAVTTAGFITLGPPDSGFSGNVLDLVRIDNARGHAAVMQLKNGNGNGLGTGYVIRLHSDGRGIIIGNNITVTPGATYWYCLKADFAVGLSYLNLYDIRGNLVGSGTLPVVVGSYVQKIYYGNEEVSRSPGHTTYFEDTLIDYTHAAFPLGHGTGGGPSSLP